MQNEQNEQQLIYECYKALGKDRPGMVKVWVDDEQGGGWWEFVSEAEFNKMNSTNHE